MIYGRYIIYDEFVVFYSFEWVQWDDHQRLILSTKWLNTDILLKSLNGLELVPKTNLEICSTSCSNLRPKFIYILRSNAKETIENVNCNMHYRLWSLWDSTKIQKFKYLENVTSFFLQIKKFIHHLLRAIMWQRVV